jgi:hypothetical protein
MLMLSTSSCLRQALNKGDFVVEQQLLDAPVFNDLHMPHVVTNERYEEAEG